jgi:hypothetical protein
MFQPEHYKTEHPNWMIALEWLQEHYKVVSKNISHFDSTLKYINVPAGTLQNHPARN